MIPFPTTPEQRVKVATFIAAMNKAGLPERFLDKAMALALQDQGAFELLELWSESRGRERDEIVADLEDLIEEHEDAPSGRVEKPYLRFDQLDGVIKDVSAFKKKLRKEIDRQGGISAVARRAGIPQPSLSRMLASASLPRRSTLYKIANALGLSESGIVTEWSR